MTDPADRPLDDCLDTFWQGDFTLEPPTDPEPDAPPPATALDGLGPSGITVGGRDLANLLRPLYRRLTDL